MQRGRGGNFLGKKGRGGKGRIGERDRGNEDMGKRQKRRGRGRGSIFF